MTYLNTRQVAQLIKIHPEHVRRLLRSGKLPGKLVARKWLVRKLDVEKYAEGDSGSRDTVERWARVLVKLDPVGHVAFIGTLMSRGLPAITDDEARELLGIWEKTGAERA